VESENDSDDGFDDDVTVVKSNAVRYPFTNLTNERKRLKCESNQAIGMPRSVFESIHPLAPMINSSQALNGVNRDLIDGYQSSAEDYVDIFHALSPPPPTSEATTLGTCVTADEEALDYMQTDHNEIDEAGKSNADQVNKNSLLV
jgi:hypothetical protein